MFVPFADARARHACMFSSDRATGLGCSARAAVITTARLFLTTVAALGQSKEPARWALASRPRQPSAQEAFVTKCMLPRILLAALWAVSVACSTSTGGASGTGGNESGGSGSTSSGGSGGSQSGSSGGTTGAGGSASTGGTIGSGGNVSTGGEMGTGG
jgi:hypothetical protein